jgi:hypothetical protein
MHVDKGQRERIPFAHEEGWAKEPLALLQEVLYGEGVSDPKAKQRRLLEGDRHVIRPVLEVVQALKTSAQTDAPLDASHLTTLFEGIINALDEKDKAIVPNDQKMLDRKLVLLKMTSVFIDIVSRGNHNLVLDEKHEGRAGAQQEAAIEDGQRIKNMLFAKPDGSPGLMGEGLLPNDERRTALAAALNSGLERIAANGGGFHPALQNMMHLYVKDLEGAYKQPQANHVCKVFEELVRGDLFKKAPHVHMLGEEQRSH